MIIEAAVGGLLAILSVVAFVVIMAVFMLSGR